MVMKPKIFQKGSVQQGGMTDGELVITFFKGLLAIVI